MWDVCPGVRRCVRCARVCTGVCRCAQVFAGVPGCVRVCMGVWWMGEGVGECARVCVIVRGCA